MNSRPNSTQLIPLGHISSAHGIRGEVLVKTYTEAPENIAAYGPLRSEDGSSLIELKIVRVTSKGVVARVKGVNDRNAAEGLRGTKLCVARGNLPDPDPDDDEWYYSDLIGMDVVDPEGQPLGRVINMHDFGAGDLLELKRPDAKSTDLVLFNKESVPNIDLAARRLTLVLPQEVAGEAPEGDGGEDIGNE